MVVKDDILRGVRKRFAFNKRMVKTGKDYRAYTENKNEVIKKTRNTRNEI